ncbi:MAG: hypothetical protein J6L88_02485 [Clostridia bacterium]|nr:hypothetical protein [Clostridia bacterium]
MAILAIAFLVICVIAAAKESKITGLYKTFGVYGRFTAYLSLFAPMGIGMFIASFFMDDIGAERWMFLAMGLFGCLICAFVYIKCPEFLKKKVIFALFASGFGLCIKLCVFFIASVWRLTGPAVVVSETGEELYVYRGEVYNGRGEHMGTANADRTAYISKN